jgi:hypothetical protein
MSPPFAILRTAKLKTFGNVAGSLSHTFRTRDTPNADPQHAAKNEHSHGTPEEIMAALKARLPAKYRKDAVLAIEYFVGASPEWFEGGKDGSDYFRAAVAWLQERHGKDNLVGWSVHRDESTPHLVAYVVPLVGDKLNAKAFTGGKTLLSKMQSDFAQKVGRKFGLARGVEGSQARHQTIAQFYGQIKQPSQHVSLSPETVQPKVLKKGVFTTEYEAFEMVAMRLTQAVQQAYTPAVESAKLAASERRRASEMQKTNQALSLALKNSQERFKELETALQPVLELASLAKGQFLELLRSASAQVAEIKRRKVEAEKARELDEERQRRVADLVRVGKTTAGASHTFAQHALKAIRQVDGNASRVDWAQVEQAAAREAIVKGQQSGKNVLQALLMHSPGMLEPERQEATRKAVERLAGEPVLAPVTERDHGLSR